MLHSQTQSFHAGWTRQETLPSAMPNTMIRLGKPSKGEGAATLHKPWPATMSVSSLSHLTAHSHWASDDHGTEFGYHNRPWSRTHRVPPFWNRHCKQWPHPVLEQDRCRTGAGSWRRDIHMSGTDFPVLMLLCQWGACDSAVFCSEGTVTKTSTGQGAKVPAPQDCIGPGKLARAGRSGSPVCRIRGSGTSVAS